jgi:hypothetical protein
MVEFRRTHGTRASSFPAIPARKPHPNKLLLRGASSGYRCFCLFSGVVQPDVLVFSSKALYDRVEMPIPSSSISVDRVNSL